VRCYLGRWNQTISTENVIDFCNRSDVQGIVTDGSVDSQHSLFTYRNIGPNATIIYDVGTRSLFNGVGRNNGNPENSGEWNGVKIPGMVVFDNTNQHAYICVPTAENQLAWKAIS